MKKFLVLTSFAGLLLLGCSQEPSLQKYFVEHAEQKNFLALDIAPSILKVNPSLLTDAQKQALASFKKVNILVFKRDAQNLKEYQSEQAKLGAILKNPDYQELMKVGSGQDGASVNYLGPDDHIQEFILYAHRTENGFAVVRVLGEDLNINTMLQMVSVFKKADLDVAQLEPLQSLMTP